MKFREFTRIGVKKFEFGSIVRLLLSNTKVQNKSNTFLTTKFSKFRTKYSLKNMENLFWLHQIR
jgi:hypothetical protein